MEHSYPITNNRHSNGLVEQARTLLALSSAQHAVPSRSTSSQASALAAQVAPLAFVFHPAGPPTIYSSLALPHLRTSEDPIPHLTRYCYAEPNNLIPMTEREAEQMLSNGLAEMRSIREQTSQANAPNDVHELDGQIAIMEAQQLLALQTTRMRNILGMVAQDSGIMDLNQPLTDGQFKRLLAEQTAKRRVMYGSSPLSSFKSVMTSTSIMQLRLQRRVHHLAFHGEDYMSLAQRQWEREALLTKRDRDMGRYGQQGAARYQKLLEVFDFFHPDSFTRLSFLPYEMRRQIWIEALPHDLPERPIFFPATLGFESIHETSRPVRCESRITMRYDLDWIVAVDVPFAATNREALNVTKSAVLYHTRSFDLHLCAEPVIYRAFNRLHDVIYLNYTLLVEFAENPLRCLTIHPAPNLRFGVTLETLHKLMKERLDTFHNLIARSHARRYLVALQGPHQQEFVDDQPYRCWAFQELTGFEISFDASIPSSMFNYSADNFATYHRQVFMMQDIKSAIDLPFRGRDTAPTFVIQAVSAETCDGFCRVRPKHWRDTGLIGG